MNILINIALCLFALMFAICGAEYALRRTAHEGLYWQKVEVNNDNRTWEGYRPLAQAVTSVCKDFEFSSGHCYPSDATGRLPLKVLNPYDGYYWYCVPYNEKQRRQGYNPDRKRQIALVGDSFVFGEGVKETDTLGHLLNETYPESNFQNWGVRGASIDTVVKQCKKIIISAPAVDEVIYFYNLNDVRMSKMVNSQQKHIIDFQNIRWFKDEERCGTIVKMISKSALFSLVRKAWVLQRESFLTIQNYKDMYLSERNRQEFLTTMDDIRSIKDMLAARGISFRIIIYPLLYKDLLGRYPFERIHAVITSACHERGVLCLDGYVPFKRYYSLKRFAVNPLDYHPNGLSNREIVYYVHEKGFITNIPE